MKSLRIYEYGLFIKDVNKSVALLIFYSFSIITNIQEIWHHFLVLSKNLEAFKNKSLLDSQIIEKKNYK